MEIGCDEVSLLAINGFQALQKPAELVLLLKRLEELSPKVILEIGSGKGGSTWAFSKLPSLKKLICLDLPNGPWGGGPTRESIGYIAQHMSGALTFLAGDSRTEAALREVKKTLKRGLIDFLLIDGDHSYAGVKSDYITYSPLVRKGGLIAFHDICKHSKESKCEVEKFWRELKKKTPKRRIKEFLSEPLSWGGIGILEKA